MKDGSVIRNQGYMIVQIMNHICLKRFRGRSLEESWSKARRKRAAICVRGHSQMLELLPKYLKGFGEVSFLRSESSPLWAKYHLPSSL